MKQIKIADTTLCNENCSFSFKEKIEIARQLQNLDVDIIELPEIKSAKTDILLIRTISSFVKKAIISVEAGMSEESIENAVSALEKAENPRIKIALPLSPVGMEYTCHKKPDKMLIWIEKVIKLAKEKCKSVEFCMIDATRAEKDFLFSAIDTAIKSGADCITVCDDATEMMPDDFTAFIKEVTEKSVVPVGVKCNNKSGLACASAIMATKAGIDCVKTAVNGETADTDTFASLVKNYGFNYDISSNVKYTKLHRTIKQILWITDNLKNDKSAITVSEVDDNSINLDKNDEIGAVETAVAKLGYDLSEEDNKKVYEEFLRVAEKKTVKAKELEAIIASVALQVPSTYKLKSYVVNNGNIIPSSAQITLIKNDSEVQGIAIGDGPIDASFLSIEQIIGHHYELDDFQIQSVTEGKEAMGSAIVKLRENGKLYSGKGISTDIIGASIRAYLNAVNKIIYEEASI